MGSGFGLKAEGRILSIYNVWLKTAYSNLNWVRGNIAVDGQMKCLMSKVSLITATSVFIISLFSAGCGEKGVIEEVIEEGDYEDPDIKEVRNIIDGLWTGSLISESTGEEKTFVAILNYGNMDLLPPYYSDIANRSPKNTDTPLGVGGVFIILSDAQADTLISGSYRFSFEWPLVIFLRAGAFYPPKYQLTTSGIVNNPMMEGTYDAFGPSGEEDIIDAGIWSAIRKEKLP